MKHNIHCIPYSLDFEWNIEAVDQWILMKKFNKFESPRKERKRKEEKGIKGKTKFLP